MRTWIQVKKERLPQMFGFILQGRKFKEKLKPSVIIVVILHEYPLSMVDHTGFREFVTDLQPMFKLVTRNTLKSDILKIYDNEKEKALKMTDKNGSRMTITTDM